MARKMTDFTLYRWRFAVGYALLGILLTLLLVFAALYVPGGLSNIEMASVVQSDSLNLKSFNPSDIVNLPYYLLQHASISILGVSTLSIKLPSLLLGLASIIGIILLLRTWFRDNVAILTTILVVTSGQFLFVTQSGANQILYIFWSVWLITAAMMISRRARFGFFWKLALFVLAALSLYTPLSIYVLIALGSAAILHPHLRYVARRLSKVRILLGVSLGVVLLLPLVYAIYKDPAIGLRLLGVPRQLPPLIDNGLQLFSQYLNFTAENSGSFITPVYGLPLVLLIGLGIYQLFSTKYTARSYVISIWIVLLAPVLLLNPRFINITFVPAVILLATGVNFLFSQWYRLFPYNPYARAAGLIPLAVLILSLVTSGVGRYAYGYHYDPEVASNFSTDLQLLETIKSQENSGTVSLISSDDESSFYKVVAKYDPSIVLVNATQDAPTVAVTRQAQQEDSYGIPANIITNSLSSNANRFYIYKTSE